jgi:tRNA threonylcarbamoyladenosine biosynthesis protein TsaB
MTILCIETSTAVCSAAIWADGRTVKQYINCEGSNHARLLPTYVEQLLDEARTQGLTIDAVALSEGPGSYTGLRIGTSTAKGLCYGLNVPLIPVPTLEVLNAASGKTGRLCPMIDARRMEVYTTDEEGKARAVVVENENSLYAGEEEVYYFGDGAAKCQAVLTKPNWHFVPDIVPEARFVGKIAEKGEKVALSAERIAYYEPYYLKEFIAVQSHVKGLQ